MFVAFFKAVIMCFPAVSAQGYWCSSVERAVPFHKCMFLTSGISGFTAVHRCKYFCAKCEHWQFSTADAGFSYSGTCTRSVGSCECTSYILSSFFFFWQFSVQLHRFHPLSEVAKASLLFAVSTSWRRWQHCWGPASVLSNKGVCQQEDGETTLRLKAQSACVSSLSTILADLACKYHGVGGQWEWAIFFYF